MDSRLEHLLRSTPNIDGNTIGVMLIRLFSLLIGLTLIIIGISFVVTPFFQFSVVEFTLGENFMKQVEEVRPQIERLTFVVGYVAIVTGVILMILRHISGYVVDRNIYIAELRSWYEDELIKREKKIEDQAKSD